ncbi:MAG: peptide ABC transporter substrate-binding protein [Actinobacteria bacterium]|nr:peptide ABC transporter substrate-binding protein [Actinomycetota bacterium]
MARALTLCARSESARADPDRAKIPKGGRFAAAAAAIVVSLLAISGAGGSGVQAPRKGGTVVFGPISEPACLNLLVAGCPGRGLQLFWIMENVLAPAFLTAPDFTPRPRLVSRVGFTRSKPFTLTYEIRPEARWSDGVPVSARDFVFTHRAILRYLPRDTAPEHRMVESIRAVDAKTVKVVLRARVASWRSLFGVVLPQHALAGEKLDRIWTDRLDNPKTGEPIGSGPFLVERWERGKQLTLVRNPRYWGLHVAYLDRLVIRFCQSCTAPPPAEVLGALRQGDVDFALSRDTGIVPELRRIAGVSVVAYPTNGWEHLELRVGPGGHPALRNKLVRRALAYGIDRTENPTSQSASFLNTSRYYVPNWKGYSYRPAVARSLLERAGCRRGGDGIYSCGGERLSLRFFTTAGARLRERGLELIQAQLRRVGVEMLLTFAPGSTLFSQILPRGEFDAVSFTFFVGDTIGGTGVFGCGGGQNVSGYCQRLVTRDLDQVDKILDASQRASLINRVDRQLANDVPVIPLYQVPFVLAYRTTIRNVVASPSNLFWNAESWWLAR